MEKGPIYQDNLIPTSRLQQARTEKHVKKFSDNGFSEVLPSIVELSEIIGKKRIAIPSLSEENQPNALESQNNSTNGVASHNDVDNSLLTEFQIRKLQTQDRNAHRFMDEIEGRVLPIPESFELTTYIIFSHMKDRKLKIPDKEYKLYREIEKNLNQFLGNFKEEVLKLFYQYNPTLGFYGEQKV